MVHHAVLLYLQCAVTAGALLHLKPCCCCQPIFLSQWTAIAVHYNKKIGVQLHPDHQRQNHECVLLIRCLGLSRLTMAPQFAGMRTMHIPTCTAPTNATDNLWPKYGA
jgi:hypothetical protein